ncbi:MAG: ABC transporter permease [Patescibacteria group bacterium]
MQLFELRGSLPNRTRLILQLGGMIFFITLWWAVVQYFEIKPSLLPSPEKVLLAFKPLYFESNILYHSSISIKLNVLGYLEAVAIAIPLGFLIGLFPFFRGLLMRYVIVLRYLPLTALLGLMILWFGIGINMKVQFLALGILVYLLPVVVQRIDEVKKIYVYTAQTLGASKWQIIKAVFIPDVISRVFDDIRVLVAISWTYIIITEVINRNQGGVGAVIYGAQRRGKLDEAFAGLIVIILIGFLQDRLMVFFDRRFFRHKYV